MAMKVFVNLPVRDLGVSTGFYQALGFVVNPQFSDENATCIVISEEIYVMLLVHPFFATFTTKDVADATTDTEVITALSVDSRAEVDRLVDKALASGGSTAMSPMEDAPMYLRSFQDPDGHQWEIVYMEMGE
ncbi:putative lactoylglutathione lyase [Actinoalloteichus hymeniacidonis]|uniref:Lactoylglutathione lyase n=2 Tax=Actinoalloteichus hymeniacidonis TaxID=340345 RepID=A0AAC9HTA9_9PSEU|nr:putative lactoylglutathione lyase [Actinoalloteichus hymeniacidonis]